MQPGQFRDFVRELRNSYGLTMYRGKDGEDSEVLDFLYEKVGNIPFESVAWIQEKFLQTNDRFPNRLHTAIATCYQAWLREHPGKFAGTRFSGNGTCRNAACDNGLLHLRKDTDQGYSAVYAYRCVDCRRSELSGIPEIRLADALRGGFTLDKDIVPAPVRDEYKPGNGRGVDLEQAMKELEELRKRREPMLGIDDDELPF